MRSSGWSEEHGELGHHRQHFEQQPPLLREERLRPRSGRRSRLRLDERLIRAELQYGWRDHNLRVQLISSLIVDGRAEQIESSLYDRKGGLSALT